ncbi:uncharacterized protein UDID_07733 [Ustilago sp. UG-2017a]|nr:uncharacterized protein UDID_07733 [Ustilago sp. UG-2017a]
MASVPLPAQSGSSKPRASATASTRREKPPTFGIMWTVMRSIGDMSLPFFFSSLSISNSHLVPSSSTPLIVCSNHRNTILDVAVLASHFPDRRPLHFWAKAGFFKSPITRFILTSSGNIKVDRRNKNNQALFEGTFEAMKAGGTIALFPEGGSYTIPKLAKLKMGAAWAALEYSNFLQLKEGGKRETEVKILPTAVVFDDKSVFRSRGVLRFGKAIRLDAYIEEFLSAPSPGTEEAEGKAKAVERVAEEDVTVPATPESMIRTNTSTGTNANQGVEEGVVQYASPAHRAVARLTADLQRAMEELTFNAPDWEMFQAVRLARELTFELAPPAYGDKELKEPIEEYVELSRAFMALLTIPASTKSKEARQALFAYSSLLHLANTDNTTLARFLRRGSSPFSSTLRSFLLRLPLYVPIFGLSLIPTYILPNALAHHFAAREEESLSSVKTLFSFFLTSMLYGTLLVKTMQWTRWSPPGLLVGLAGVWFLHDLNRSNVDTAYSLVKQLRLGWRARSADLSIHSAKKVERKQEEAVKGRKLFFYGTLVHPKILARVIGNNGSHLRVQNAVLNGARLYHVRGAEYPGLLRDAESGVKGTLVSGLTEADVRCLDAFEGDEYTRISATVIPDPSAPVERNSDRITNAGSAPLHAILSGLTKERMQQLCKTQSRAVDGVEVYRWTAGENKLQMDKAWEFDIFAREHAKNWVGEEEVEHEHEYQIVDSMRGDSTATLTTTPPAATTPTIEGDEWIEARASTLVSEDEKVKAAVVKVCKQLQEKPSIQFYVDKAFPRSEGVRRPKLDNLHLVQALVRARKAAKASLEELLAEIGGDERVQEALGTLAVTKARVLSRAGVELSEDGAACPFTQALLQSYAAGAAESRKNV